MQTLSNLIRCLCLSLVAVLALPTSLVRAEMLGAEAAMPQQVTSQVDLDRARVQQFLERASVTEKLQAMGVAGLNARDRVDSLTHEEVHALAQRIDAMPAGGALSQNDLILILLIAILLAIAI